MISNNPYDRNDLIIKEKDKMLERIEGPAEEPPNGGKVVSATKLDERIKENIKCTFYIAKNKVRNKLCRKNSHIGRV